LSNVGPCIFLSTLLSKTSRRFCSVTVIAHVSQPCVTVGRMIDLYICSLLAALRSLFFRSFWQTKVMNLKCLFRFSLQLLSKIYLFKNSARYYHAKYPLFLPDFNQTRNVSTNFRKTIKYQISRKSVQWVPSCSMHTNGQADKTKLKVVFRNIPNAPVALLVLLIFTHRQSSKSTTRCLFRSSTENYEQLNSQCRWSTATSRLWG
jgi:hypothetical protein